MKRWNKVVRKLNVVICGLLCFFLIIYPMYAFSEDRVALVVGISNYRAIAKLENANNDATAMASALHEAGFRIIGENAQLDLEKSSFERLIREFGHRLNKNSVGLFYYAGHAVQVNGNNYLAPIQANPKFETDVKFDFVDANTIVDVMAESSNSFNIIILDSCRNNPWVQSKTRAINGGLAQMRVTSGIIVSYSTQPGNIAMDGANGHSPYTEALIESMRKPGLDVYRFFNDIGLGVKRRTNGLQQPWVSMSPIETDFFFHPSPRQAVSTNFNNASASDEIDYQFWQTVKKNHGNEGLVKEYLLRFPNGNFSLIAKAMLEEHNKSLWVGLSPSTNNTTPVLPPNSDTVFDFSRAAKHDSAVECDKLAGGQNDQQRIGPGVERSKLNPLIALPECKNAVFNHRHNLRLKYELARVFEYDGKLEEAIPLMEFVAMQGYTAAESFMGAFYEFGRGVSKDRDQAIGYYTKAARKGDKFAISGLYRLNAKLPEVH